MAGKQRAHSDAERAERRRVLLDVARSQLRERPWPAITMARVADEAGLAKGTTYLYFPTKEALFLALAEEDVAEWFDAVDRGLESADVADVLVGTLAERPDLLRLLAILHAVLEQNVDADTAARFKRFLLARVRVTGARIEARLGGRPGTGGRLLLHLYAVAIGLWSMADPPPALRELHDDPSLSAFAIDFATELRAALGPWIASFPGASS